MASTAKVIVPAFEVPRPEPVLRPVPAPSPRRDRWGWLQLLREGWGGALVLLGVIALWTLTWAALAGPLSPAHERPVPSIEARN